MRLTLFTGGGLGRPRGSSSLDRYTGIQHPVQRASLNPNHATVTGDWAASSPPSGLRLHIVTAEPIDAERRPTSRPFKLAGTTLHDFGSRPTSQNRRPGTRTGVLTTTWGAADFRTLDPGTSSATQPTAKAATPRVEDHIPECCCDSRCSTPQMLAVGTKPHLAATPGSTTPARALSVVPQRSARRTAERSNGRASTERAPDSEMISTSSSSAPAPRRPTASRSPALIRDRATTRTKTVTAADAITANPTVASRARPTPQLRNAVKHTAPPPAYPDSGTTQPTRPRDQEDDLGHRRTKTRKAARSAISISSRRAASRRPAAAGHASANNALRSTAPCPLSGRPRCHTLLHAYPGREAHGGVADAGTVNRSGGSPGKSSGGLGGHHRRSQARTTRASEGIPASGNTNRSPSGTRSLQAHAAVMTPYRPLRSVSIVEQDHGITESAPRANNVQLCAVSCPLLGCTRLAHSLDTARPPNVSASKPTRSSSREVGPGHDTKDQADCAA